MSYINKNRVEALTNKKFKGETINLSLSDLHIISRYIYQILEGGINE